MWGERAPEEEVSCGKDNAQIRTRQEDMLDPAGSGAQRGSGRNSLQVQDGATPGPHLSNFPCRLSASLHILPPGSRPSPALACSSLPLPSWNLLPGTGAASGVVWNRSAAPSLPKGKCPCGLMTHSFGAGPHTQGRQYQSSLLPLPVSFDLLPSPRDLLLLCSRS